MQGAGDVLFCLILVFAAAARQAQASAATRTTAPHRQHAHHSTPTNEAPQTTQNATSVNTHTDQRSQLALTMPEGSPPPDASNVCASPRMLDEECVTCYTVASDPTRKPEKAQRKDAHDSDRNPRQLEKNNTDTSSGDLNAQNTLKVKDKRRNSKRSSTPSAPSSKAIHARSSSTSEVKRPKAPSSKAIHASSRSRSSNSDVKRPKASLDALRSKLHKLRVCQSNAHARQVLASSRKGRKSMRPTDGQLLPRASRAKQGTNSSHHVTKTAKEANTSGHTNALSMEPDDTKEPHIERSAFAQANPCMAKTIGSDDNDRTEHHPEKQVRFKSANTCNVRMKPEHGILSFVHVNPSLITSHFSCVRTLLSQTLVTLPVTFDVVSLNNNVTGPCPLCGV